MLWCRTACCIPAGRCRMSRTLRAIAVPFVAAVPAGARVRTRLRLSADDEAVLRAAGSHLGSLAGRDLAARCAQGRLDANGRAASRAARKRGPRQAQRQPPRGGRPRRPSGHARPTRRPTTVRGRRPARTSSC